MPAPIPCHARSELVVGAPGDGPGWWAGGPSAVLDDGTWWLAYRLRRPVDEGRGYANVIARSDDGRSFETVCVLDRDAFGAASLERPALVRTAEGRWRVYISCSTPGSKHWWVDALDAPEPAAFDPDHRTTVFPGDDRWAMKDPVVHPPRDGRPWTAWVCCHPLDVAGAEDRMTTSLATSGDGLSWDLGALVLEGRAGRWDERGTRVASVQPGPDGWVLYDGRANEHENFEERTGLAVPAGDRGRLVAVGNEPAAASPHAGGCLRYVAAVAQPDGSYRLYYESSRADGAHELRTEVI
jgi:hypothetical protein